MRVLVIVSCFAPGGAERQLIALLRGADQTRLQISVACLYRRNWHERAQAIPGVTIHHLGKSGRYAFIGVIWRAYRLARALRPDVVYGYMTPQDMIALLVGKLTGARVIWAIRNSHTPLGAYNLLHRFLVLAARALARFPNLIIANSSAGAADYEAAGYPAARIQVIPNGIDLTDFVRDEAGREEWRKRLGVSSGEVLVGLVGRLVPQKGHTDFIDAAAAAAKRNAKLAFLIAGTQHDDQYREQLLAQAQAVGIADRLRWLAHVDEPASLYSTLDIAVLASPWGEGFPNTIGEAMACEVPCVVTGVGDCAAIVGDTGIVVPPSQSDALASAIVQLAAADRHALGTRARQRVGDLYAVSTMVERTTAAFEKLVANTGRAAAAQPSESGHGAKVPA